MVRHRRRQELDDKSKLAAYYQSLADDYFETDRYLGFVGTLGHVDELVLDWIDSDAFRRMFLLTIQQTYPPHEWTSSRPLRGLMDLWIRTSGSSRAKASAPVEVAAESVSASSLPADGVRESERTSDRADRPAHDLAALDVLADDLAGMGVPLSDRRCSGARGCGGGQGKFFATVLGRDVMFKLEGAAHAEALALEGSARLRTDAGAPDEAVDRRAAGSCPPLARSSGASAESAL